SATAIWLVSSLPGPYPSEAVVPQKEMTHIRDEINRITQSRRMLAHGLVSPQLGQTDLDFMEQQAATLKVDAWKSYTGAAAKGFDRGWFLDDEKLAYPMLERARKLGVRRFCGHKGLPLGPNPDYNHQRDRVRRAAMQDRGVPALGGPARPQRHARLRAAHPRGQGAGLRAQRGAGVRRGRERCVQ